MRLVPNFHYARDPGGLGWILTREYRTVVALRLPGKHRRQIKTNWGTITQIDADHCAIRVFKGFQWDGPSGPVIDAIAKTAMRASLVHDFLYWLLREGLLGPRITYRWHADRIYREHCREDGMGWLRAWWQWRGLRLFASGSAKPGGGAKR